MAKSAVTKAKIPRLLGYKMFSFFRRPQADPRPIEEVLRTAAAIPESDKEMSVRVWQRVSKKIEAPMFEAVRESLTPSPELQRSVWHRIKSSIEAVSSNVWSDVESELTPSHNMFDVVWQRLVMRLAPTPVPVRRLSPVLRWSASALLLALLIQISPVLFSSQSIASSEVLLTPKKGDVSILIAGLWQPVTDPVLWEYWCCSLLVPLVHTSLSICPKCSGITRSVFTCRFCLKDSSSIKFLKGGRIYLYQLLQCQNY
jgi:hypothetical protein